MGRLLAVLSDVHGNQPALEAMLQAVDEASADEIWFLGDAVGYGARPEECCRLLRERAAQALCGNHDLACIGAISLADFRAAIVPTFHWTRAQLSEQSKRWLGELKPQRTGGEIGLYHGSPRDPIWEYLLSVPALERALAAARERLVLVGHSHLPLAYSATGDESPFGADEEWRDLGDERWVLNPGSVGQPRDDDWRASALLIDRDENRFRHLRVPYDVEAAVSAIEAAGLPESFGTRLRYGD